MNPLRSLRRWRTRWRTRCCRRPGSLYVAETKNVPDGKMIIRRCQECNRRHFEVQARPKTMSARL